MTLHSRLVYEVGRDIVSGRRVPGETFRLEDIQDTFRVSRTVARDGMHVLEGLGLIRAYRGRGIVVQAVDEWNVLDPALIMLRLDSPERDEQLRELVELRAAIEPTAARLAAVRASAEQRERVVELADEVRAAGEAGDAIAMMEADVQLHGLILEATGNSALRALRTAVETVLRGRAKLGLLPCPPAPLEVDLHASIAAAVRDGDAERAFADAMTLLNAVSETV